LLAIQCATTTWRVMYRTKWKNMEAVLIHFRSYKYLFRSDFHFILEAASIYLEADCIILDVGLIFPRIIVLPACFYTYNHSKLVWVSLAVVSGGASCACVSGVFGTLYRRWKCMISLCEIIMTINTRGHTSTGGPTIPPPTTTTAKKTHSIAKLRTLAKYNNPLGTYNCTTKGAGGRSWLIHGWAGSRVRLWLPIHCTEEDEQQTISSRSIP